MAKFTIYDTSIDQLLLTYLTTLFSLPYKELAS